MYSSLASEAELSQFLLGCPLQMKIGSNVCYCTCPPWMKQSKRKIKRLRKLIGKFFTQDDCDVFLLHLIPYADRVCTCPHGNYMIQEVMAGASSSSIQVFISSCEMEGLMTNEFGSRVVEALTEIHNGAYVPLILNRIAHNFGHLARNPRANYGIQKLCGHMPLEKYARLLRVAVPYTTELSMDPHGAYVVQVMLNKLCGELLMENNDDHENDDRQGHRILSLSEAASADKVDEDDGGLEQVYTLLSEMLTKLVELGPYLIQHPCGNFTVQVMIGALKYCQSAEKKFVEGICENIVPYVGCKFGTRVVESVLENGGVFARRMIVQRLLDANQHEFAFFSRAESAQYLFAKVLMCADEVQKKELQARLPRQPSPTLSAISAPSVTLSAISGSMDSASLSSDAD